jgi:hypothetical protein
MLLIFMLSDAIGIDVNSGRGAGQHSMPALSVELDPDDGV